jgi:CubicO group peptidase (beta-lactamase class C family)
MTAYSAAFDWARRTVTEGRLPTAVLGIATAEGTVALDAFGSTNGRAARTDDHYRLFSITKPLTGLVALRAIERGHLTPETPLTTALPDFGANRDDVVRLAHLVSHTSGVREPALDVADLRTELLKPGRDFAAGAASRYSSVAFDGVAALIEHATGETWEAGLSALGDDIGASFTFDESTDPHTVIDAEANGLDIAAMARLRHPGAGAIGRAADLLALGTALLRNDGTVVHPATAAMMLRPLTGDIPRLEPYPAERGQDWGFAWNLRTRAPGLIDRDVYGHGGWSGTEFWVHPGAGVAYVLLTNQGTRPGVDADELDNAIIAGR